LVVFFFFKQKTAYEIRLSLVGSEMCIRDRVTPDEVPDPQALRIRSLLNDHVMQDDTTGNMMFGVAELIARLSRDTTLLPGTVILTGTPEAWALPARRRCSWPTATTSRSTSRAWAP